MRERDLPNLNALKTPKPTIPKTGAKTARKTGLMSRMRTVQRPPKNDDACNHHLKNQAMPSRFAPNNQVNPSMQLIAQDFLAFLSVRWDQMLHLHYIVLAAMYALFSKNSRE